MLSLEDVKKNSKINEFIGQTIRYMDSVGYTDHGFRHVNIVADRAKSLAGKIGLNLRQQELAGIAGYCHDMGNFLGRTWHHYFAATLFMQVYLNDSDNPGEVASVAQAIVTHDKEELKFANRLAAILVIADKSDVHRSRVKKTGGKNLEKDIHDRVNYSVTDNKLLIDKRSKTIALKLKVDTKITSVLEYFEIFTARTTYCRTAAGYLGYKFHLEINNFKLT